MASLCLPKFWLSGGKTMKRRHGGFLSACVASWRATAYHVSAALEGFSRTSGMSLHALRALPSPTVFRRDRFLITMFPCAALLLRTQQQATPACHTDKRGGHETALRLQKWKVEMEWHKQSDLYLDKRFDKASANQLWQQSSAH